MSSSSGSDSGGGGRTDAQSQYGGGSYDKAAWYLSNLSVTFMVDPGVDPSQYAGFNQDIVQAVEPKNPIRESDFDIDFTTVKSLSV